MKKLLILTAMLCCMGGMTAHAEIIDAVYTTDIGALIDFCPIKSYNISDSTYIKAEDLRGYGFDVDWNADARTLKISVNDKAQRTILPEEEINIKKSDIPVHQKLYDVYSTDIKTYLNGEEIHACNIDGETLIKYRDMESVAYITYDDEKRLAGMDVIAKQLDNAYFNNASSMTDLTLAEGKTYHGQVKDRKPDGIGEITDKSRIDYSPGTINDLVTTAYFADGDISGFYYTEGTYEETIGSSLGTYIKSELGNTKVNYSVVQSNYHVDGMYCSIVTLNPDYANSSTGTICRTVTDSSYLYGIKNTDIYEYTTYTDGDVDIEPLDHLPKFSHFTTDYEASVITEDGEMFSLPYGWDYKHSVSTLTGTNEADKRVTDGRYEQHSAEYDWLVTEDNKLYGFYYDRSDYRNPKYNSVLLAENIKSAQAAYLYVSGDGTLYEDMHDGNGFRVVDTDVKMVSGTSYVVYLKNDGSVWTYRSNSQKELGHEWNDGKDYSKPVNRAEDAVYVNNGDSTSFMYIKKDGSLWAQGSSYNGEKGVIEQFNYDTVTYEQEMAGEAVKLGDGFVSCKDGAVSLALKENGDLYAWGENKNGIIDKSGGEYVLTPVKVAGNVRDYHYMGIIYIIKNDGALYCHGSKQYLYGGYDEEIDIEDFEQCEKVYKKRQHTVIPEPEQKYDSPYPPVPFNGRQYYVIYREGYRDNRIELAVFDITSTVDALEWDGQVLGDVNKDGSYVNDIKYYLDGDKWVEFERGYERVSNNATEVIDGNIDVIYTAQ